MAGVEPLIGRTLAGRFRITGFIGEGAMASVFRGVDMTQAGPLADVAVKVMHPHLVSDPTFTGRFRLEAQAAARLSHPNSVRIVDTGADGQFHFIAMELVMGRDLAEILTMERRISPARACRILRGVCDALGTAHQQNIVHRDLKPENVMVVDAADAPGGETVKVLDFGIAKLLDAPAGRPGDTDSGPTSALTRVGTVVGTPAYMSPEQCRGQQVDGRSDLYTCGILLYQLVTGKVPFWSENPFEIAAKQVREKPVPPSHQVDGLDPELEAIILKALSKTPSDRFTRAEELRDVLAALEPRLSDQRLSPRQGPLPPRPQGMPDPAPPDPMPPPAPGLSGNGSPPLTPPIAGPGGPLGGPMAGPMGGFAPAPPPGMSPAALTPLPSNVGPGPGQVLLGAQNVSDAEAAKQALLARVRGGTIPMGAGLDAIVRQIHEDAARDGTPLDPALRNLTGTPAQMQMQLQQAANAPAPAVGRPNGAILAVMVFLSIAVGVGAGVAAYVFSR
jgi:serine/threonine protein kinase